MKSAKDVEGLINLDAGRLLRDLAGTVPVGQVIVEIGAFKGRSTCFLAEGARPGVPILSIDPHGLPGSERGRQGRFAGDEVRAEYLENIKGYDAVVPVRALSKDAVLPTQPIGLLWIDGAHDEQSVKIDVERFAGLVASGGHIVFDDYGTWHKGVDKAVNLLQKDTGTWGVWRFRPLPLAWTMRR